MSEEANKESGIEIYTDGACEPNPGPGGWGVVLVHPKKRREESGGFRATTNNRMEIYAAIKGLELLTKEGCKVTLFSDSQYLVNAMTEGWVLAWKKKDWWRTNKERASNADLWEKLLGLCEKHVVEFRWVKGHAGNVENERCDILSQLALRKPDLPADDGYENKPESEGGRPRPKEEGDICWKCGEPVLKQKSSKKPKGDYYYEYYLWCPKCQATYEVQEAKRLVEKPPELF